jgi:hypothetical protein
MALLKTVMNSNHEIGTTFRAGRPLINLKNHGIADYVIGAVLVFSPYVFGFDNLAVARNLFLVLGLGLIAYSLLTRYPLSIAKIIPLGVHMTLDVIAGVVLLFAPYVFAYRDSITDFQYALHVIYGVAAIALVAFTRPKSESISRVDRDIQDDLRKAA